VTLPARFQLVAAMNPCPCGGAADGEAVCRCPSGVPERYSGRVSGPLRDRIDLQVWLGRVHAMELVGGTEPEPSAPVAARIAAARDRQMTRQRALNGRLSGRHLRTLCGLDDASRRRAVALAELERSSARGTDRLLRVARTIADLDGAARVGTPHLDEAARFRLGLGPGSRLAAAV
jgi:magnesium chelatase family protein